DTGDPRRPGDLPGHCRRQAGDRRGCERGSDVAALLHRLMRGESLLAVLQLSDSSFPSGRYTLSHRLEPFAQRGALQTPRAAHIRVALLGDYVRFSVGASDAVALACAHRAVDPGGSVDVELAGLADRRLCAVKLTRETREASTRTGRALLAAAPAV